MTAQPWQKERELRTGKDGPDQKVKEWFKVL